ncbi:B2 bradykinin receptor-like [Micropterus salmoides]|uniref:B2 bradykinin receptor-like n=1 Tax=Micropterus salmoides TaxID=27706 RepID=UPI0018EA9B7F|nr:B2 bradykinin receptor-like [Micropterus salmoides]XP_038585444.1 B2 bradykinin receptor-like [Micropterus salmoides]
MALQPTSPTTTHGVQNHTNATTCPTGENHEWIYTVIPLYILIITVLGIVLNLFVLMVFWLHKKACTVAEIYLSNLAAADLVLMACLPSWAVNVSNGFNWPFDQILCKVFNMGITMNVYCSIYFLVLVSIDRYVALVHTMSHERMRRPRNAKLGCVLVWGLGFLLSVHTLIFRDLKHDPGLNFTKCYLKYRNINEELLYEGMLTTFTFIIPIAIICYCTIKIIQALNNRLMQGLNSQKVEHKATTLVLAVLLAFLICWVPFRLLKIVELLIKANVLQACIIIKVQSISLQFFVYLAFFNSVLNPILYVIVGKNFRKRAKELFTQWSNKRTSTLTINSTRSNLLRSFKLVSS